MKLKLIKLGVKLFEISYFEILMVGFVFWSLISVVVCSYQLYTDLKTFHNSYDAVLVDIFTIELLITIGCLVSCAFISLVLKMFKKQHKKKYK